MTYNFGPAAPNEKIAFGASMAGLSHPSPIPDAIVTMWIQAMRKHGIQRVCCLLPTEQLDNYQSNLLNLYADFFGAPNVCYAPIPDFHLINLEISTDDQSGIVRGVVFLKKSVAVCGLDLFQVFSKPDYHPAKGMPLISGLIYGKPQINHRIGVEFIGIFRPHRQPNRRSLCRWRGTHRAYSGGLVGLRTQLYSPQRSHCGYQYCSYSQPL